MKGQFFIIATIVIISSLSLIIRYLYDFNKINLTKLDEMYELNYIQYVKESYKKTINAVLSNDGCERLEADLNYTTKFLKDDLNKKGIMMLTEGPIIETQCTSVKFNFSLISSEFYTHTTFIFSTCIDGTLYGECSSTKPLYCDNNGNLINYCSYCGCPSKYECQPDESCIPIYRTFGNINIGSLEDAAPPQYIYGCKFTMPESGEITKITAYVSLANSGNMKFAIYSSDNNGNPDRLLAESSPTSVGTSYDWYNFTISYSGTGNTDYHFIFIADQICYIRYDDGEPDQATYKGGQTYPTFPDPFGALTGHHPHELSIYATYT